MGRVGWFVESKLSPWLHRRNQYVTVSLPSARDLADLGVDPDRDRRGAQRPRRGSARPRLTVPRSATPRVVVLSRLVPHKQIEDALDAVAELRSRISGSAPRRPRRWLVGGAPGRPRRPAGRLRRGDVPRPRRRSHQTPCPATELGACAAVVQGGLGPGGDRGGPARGAHHRLPVVGRADRFDRRRGDGPARRRPRRAGRSGWSGCSPTTCCANNSA